MSTAFDTLVQHFEENDLAYQLDRESQQLRAGFRAKSGSYHVLAWVDEEDGAFQVLARASMLVPEGSRPAVAEAITRANYGLRVGKFEMDFSDGEVRFHATTLLVDGNLHDEIIHRVIGAAIVILDRYMPAIMSVIYGNELPKEAIGHVEAGLRPSGIA